MITNRGNPGVRPAELVNELVSQVGARPAGGASERQAMQWIEEKLAGKYTFLTESFSFSPQPAFLPYYSVVGIFLLASALLLKDFPWLGLVVPGLVAVLPDLYDWVIQRLPKRAQSQNLWVIPAGSEVEGLNLLFVAHVDTARVIPAGYGAVLFDPLRRQIFSTMQRAALILVILSLVSLLGIQFGSGVIAAAVTVALIVALTLTGLDIWDQRAARSQFSAGANDNGSGVGVLVALAEQIDPGSFQHLKIGFLFTGAEEAGLWGARHAARRLARAGCRPAVICVDMVGAGESMRIMLGRRSIRGIRTDPEINAWLERADHLAVQHLALRRSSDFEAFWEVGIPTGWIESSGTPNSWRAYHTQRDQLDGIDRDALGQAYEMLSRLVDHIERAQFLPGQGQPRRNGIEVKDDNR